MEIQGLKMLILIGGLCCVGLLIIDIITKDRPGLSSERAPHRDKITNFRPKHLKRKQYLVIRPQSGHDTKIC
jgi:hypothetical protein